MKKVTSNRPTSFFGFALVALFCSCATQNHSSKSEVHSRGIASQDPEVIERKADRCAEKILEIPDAAGASWSESSKAFVEAAFLNCLSSYVQIPTVNPSGDEELAAQYLKRVFDRLEIESQVLDVNGRTGLVAFVRPEGVSPGQIKPSVILYHHTDVVPVFESQWLRPDLAFSGAIEPHPGQPSGAKYLWGRGSLDMKSVGIMQLLTMAFANRQRGELKKTVAYLASPDEEVGALGAKGLINEIREDGDLRELTQAQVLLNEGGYGVVRNERPVFLIGTEEKGGAWLTLSHDNPKALFSHLDRLMALFDPGTGKGQLQAGCELISMSTPGQQVNVVPAKAILSVTCPPEKGRVDPIQLEKAFRESFATQTGLTIQAIQSAPNVFELSINLASTGHGSLGALSALQVAARGLQNIGVIPPRAPRFQTPAFYRYQRTPATNGLIAGLKEVYPITTRPGFLLRAADSFSWIGGVDQFFLKSTATQAYSERLFRTSCTWTGFEVSPRGANALVDCRLIHPGYVRERPSIHGDYFVSELRSLANDNTLSIELTNRWNYTASPHNGAVFAALSKAISDEAPGAIVAPWLTPTSSDSTWFRAPQTAQSSSRPIPSYGFFPVSAGDLIGTIHGSNERFPVDQAFKSSKIYTSAVMELIRK